MYAFCSSSFLSMSGGALGRPCTTSGQANVLFFNGGNDLATINREVITRDLNTTLADYVSFYIVIGENASHAKCHFWNLQSVL